MLESASSDGPRVKRQRVRTGCITCKIRRVKCDEHRPVCQRCVVDKRKCDGYPEPRSPSRTRAKQQTLKFINCYTQTHPNTLTLNPALGSLPCTKDAHLLHQAWTHAIKGCTTSCIAEQFWYGLVYPLSFNSKSVQQSLCALVGAHRHFLVTSHQTLQASHTPAPPVSAIQHYNEAISTIKHIAANNSPDALRTTIVCCIIFISIENLYGRSIDSIRHLHSACHLLGSLRTVGAGPHGQLFSTVTKMLRRLGQNVAIHLGDEVVFAPDFATSAIRLHDAKVPFVSVLEADEHLEEISSIYSDFLFAPDPDEWPKYGHFHRRWNGTWQMDQPSIMDGVDQSKRVLEASKAAYQIWESRFDLMKREGPVSNSGQRQLALVALHQSLWSTLIKREAWPEQLRIEDWQTLLRRAGHVMKHDARGQEPVFTFDGDVVPALFTVWSSCHDRALQTQAIDLMRSSHRREGLWDSMEVADLCEGWAGSQKGTSKGRSSPRGIPELMGSLRTPAASSHNGIIPAFSKHISGSRSPGKGLQRICDTG